MKQEKSSPLTRQVGGDHYKIDLIQPIEVMTTLAWTYTQGAIFKYVARFRRKNGEEDLNKAIHLADIWISYRPEFNIVNESGNAYIETYVRLMDSPEYMRDIMWAIHTNNPYETKRLIGLLKDKYYGKQQKQ